MVFQIYITFKIDSYDHFGLNPLLKVHVLYVYAFCTLVTNASVLI